MVSATLNQDMKELATMTLKEPLTFTVQQQQRKADLANLKLAQYLVRLKFDDVEARAPRETRKERLSKDTKKEKRQRKKFTDKDFDSEEEYASNVVSEDGSDIEYDDGKKKPEEGSEGSDDSDDASADGASIDQDDDGLSYGDEMSEGESLEGEQGEDEFDESMESEMEESKSAKKAKKAGGDGYEFVKEDGQSATQPAKEEKETAVAVEEPQQEFFDRYRMDPLLVRREATLLVLALKGFRKRVIVFVNEKKQCGRLHSLFAFFGLKSVEVHGDLHQEQRLNNVEIFQRGEADFLIATDLVARGIDISAVKAVLNFSFPTEPKRYLHRVGRTARAGSYG